MRRLAAAAALAFPFGAAGGESPSPAVGQEWRATSATAEPPERMTGMCQAGELPEDGLAIFWITHLWKGFEGRYDLGALRAQGVRALRLYPCVVDTSMVKIFLDRAWNQGLTVVPELPARLFLRRPGGCFTEGGTPTFLPFDCYAQVREASRRLLSYILAEDGSNKYHPAVEMVLLIREPDVATPRYCGGCGQREALRATLSAWDGLMDAENELGVNTEGVRITAVLSTAAESGGPVMELPRCYRYRAPWGGCAGSHILRSLWLGANWLDNETHVPHNNLSAAIVYRWVHAFGADAESSDVIRTLRDYYEFLHPIPPRETSAALLDFGGHPAPAAIEEQPEPAAGVPVETLAPAITATEPVPLGNATLTMVNRTNMTDMTNMSNMTA